MLVGGRKGIFWGGGGEKLPKRRIHSSHHYRSAELEHLRKILFLFCKSSLPPQNIYFFFYPNENCFLQIYTQIQVFPILRHWHCVASILSQGLLAGATPSSIQRFVAYLLRTFISLSLFIFKTTF